MDMKERRERNFRILEFRENKYDIVGDVHGCYDELIELVEKLGYARVSELLNGNCKEALLAIVAEDKALEVEANSKTILGRPASAHREIISLKGANSPSNS